MMTSLLYRDEALPSLAIKCQYEEPRHPLWCIKLSKSCKLVKSIIKLVSVGGNR